MSVVYIKSNNIISPLGFTTEENFISVKNGKTGIKYYASNTLDIPEAFSASIIDNELLDAKFSEISQKEITKFEKMLILSVHDAAKKASFQLSDKRTLFILSTTKGNINSLNQSNLEENKTDFFLAHSAKVMTSFFGNTNEALIVSNACISGLTAAVVAKRMLNTGYYDNVVVVGADVVSKFIVSGFQSFKALSVEACKPFDANRTGLNIGEGAATAIFSLSKTESELPKGTIILESGAITNDANHISGPSRTGEGLFLGLQKVLKNSDFEPSFVSAHGTATPFNDEMESIAFTRVGLENVPTNSFKGYFGHTLGAAGILELIMSAKSLQENLLIKSLGYETSGVSKPLNIITKTEEKQLKSCVKTVSGFGGCNAVGLLKKVS